MRTGVIAIFDIGKTNKKFFLFDEEYRELHNNYIRFDEILDQDGFPMENLPALVSWVRNCIEELLLDDRYEILGVNFSTYGASQVAIDDRGEALGDFYNYLKPFPIELENAFFQKYGDKPRFCTATASPYLGMLNSGLQLYFLSKTKGTLIDHVKTFLHLPQYLSYLLSGKICADYTSIGCHTGMWDFGNSTYHRWLEEEQIQQLIPKVVPSDTSYYVNYLDKTLKVGVGVHDSSAAMLPYMQASKEPFVLISTGTWSICMNSYNKALLTTEDLEKDCLNFMSAGGGTVRASRLFLGSSLREQVIKLGDYFGVDYHGYKTIPFDAAFVSKRSTKNRLLFDYEQLAAAAHGFEMPSASDFSKFDSFEDAYHQLMDELTDVQIESLKLAIGNSSIKRVYIDGGFGANELFTQMLADKLPHLQIFSTSFSLGSALGAAMLVNNCHLPDGFMENNYSIRRHYPMKVTAE